MWQDLADHTDRTNKRLVNSAQQTGQSYTVAHLNCARATNICHRLGVTGFPTLSVLTGNAVYDYQGPLTVEALNDYIVNKEYKKSARARNIWHERSAVENL